LRRSFWARESFAGVAGFDLIYATQDYDFDRREGIHSLVVKLGIPQALRLAQLLHLTVLIALVAFRPDGEARNNLLCAMLPVAAALLYEHQSARARDVARHQSRLFPKQRVR